MSKRFRRADPLPGPLPRERENIAGHLQERENYLRAGFLRLAVRAVGFLRETVFFTVFRFVAGRFFLAAGLGRGFAAAFAFGVPMGPPPRFPVSAAGLLEGCTGPRFGAHV